MTMTLTFRREILRKPYLSAKNHDYVLDIPLDLDLDLAYDNEFHLDLQKKNLL